MKTDRRVTVIDGRQAEEPGCVNVKGRTRWEYRSSLMDRAADLSQFGAEGWECYAVVPAPADMAVFYFRRPM